MTHYTCPKCGGTGKWRYLDTTGTCVVCNGDKKVEVDATHIEWAIVSTAGPNRGNLRVKKGGAMLRVFGAEYVWHVVRMLASGFPIPDGALFSVGVSSVLDSNGEAVLDALDAVALDVAKRYHGYGVE